MQKKDIVHQILTSQSEPCSKFGSAFAPTNIALCKYWGKRNEELNLPYQSSLSISLPDKGVHTVVSVLEDVEADLIILNNQEVSLESTFASRLISFLDLFRANQGVHFQVETTSNIPIAAGLASSACGFAALVQSLNSLYGWQLSKKMLSILARLGSGSACRSLWEGFVEWRVGSTNNGMDSYGEPFSVSWQDLNIGILILSSEKKALSSREAMKQSLNSHFYSSWVQKSQRDLDAIKNSIIQHDFSTFGSISEANSLALHALIQTSWPPINYTLPLTLSTIQKIWSVRNSGLEIYFTQDAGPNLILLFMNKDINKVLEVFPSLQVVNPFPNANLPTE